MKNFKQFSRRDFVTISGRAGLTTLVASAMGVNLGYWLKSSAAAGQDDDAVPICDPHGCAPVQHRGSQIRRVSRPRGRQVNNMKPRPDFVVYCGDIAQNGRDDQLQKGQRFSPS
jgi:3',5'-cyclic-AMP phosphodiesterase